MLHRASPEIATIFNLCARFQPNSSLWQAQPGLGRLTGIQVGSFVAPSILPTITGGMFDPSAPAAIYMALGMCEPIHTSGLGLSEPKQRPQPAMAHLVDKVTGNTTTGSLSTFNSLNNDSHSRLDDWPQPYRRKRAKPGGGSIAAS